MHVPASCEYVSGSIMSMPKKAGFPGLILLLGSLVTACTRLSPSPEAVRPGGRYYLSLIHI